jgi:transcriptional regulator NrdR family protein
VSYLRFASVYQEIESAEQFLELLRPWVGPSKDAGETGK